MNVMTTRKENGKLMISLIRKESRTLSPRTSEQFHIGKSGLFINELKVNSPIKLPRKFVVSIRLDGKSQNQGQCKLAQMSLDEQELRELRDNIDSLLKDKL